MKENNVITKSAWSLNCKEATYLTELSKEGKLNLLLRLRLWYHLTICQSCKNFKKQTELMVKRLKRLGTMPNDPKHNTLTSSDKDQLKAEIQKVLKEQ